MLHGERPEKMHAPISDREKPYIEYHAGRAVRKVSPRSQHALAQGSMLVILRRCAGPRYRVGTEWDCDLSAQLHTKTILVPDVCAIALERFEGLTGTQSECPPFAPDVVVEVRSPNDRPAERDWKVEAYLGAGTHLVLDVLPQQREIRAMARDGLRSYHEGDVFEHEAAPWLRFEVAEAFAELLP